MWCPDSLKQALLLICLVLVAGCGFQLRGTDIGAIEAVSVAGSASSKRALVDALETRGVRVSASAPGVVSVRILDESTSRRVVATSANIDAAQYALGIQIEVSISRDQQSIAEAARLSAERIYSVDSINLSGSYEEQQILMDEMRQELAGQVIRRIEAWLVNEQSRGAD